MRKKKNRRFNKSKHRLFTPWLYIKVSGLVLLFSGIAILVIRIPTLRMFKIDTIKANINIDQDIMKKIKGASIISIDAKIIHNQIRRRHPEVKEIHVTKMFPSVLIVEALKRKPFVQLKKDAFYVLDEERVVLERRSQNPYPGIFTIELGNCNVSFNVGSQVCDKRLYLAYELIKELKQSDLMSKFKITSINATKPYSILFFIDDVEIIIGKGDFRNKIRPLEKLLDKKFSNKTDSIRYIDLRFASSDNNIYIGYKR